MNTEPVAKQRTPHFGRHILIGFFTLAPLWVTWVVFEFLLGQLAKVGDPALQALARLAKPTFPALSDWLTRPSFHYSLAVFLTLAGLYLIGLLASRVLGRKLISQLERLLLRLPLVQTVYSGTKRLLDTLRSKPAGAQRVVLINFPSPEMKALGFVTQVLRDQDSGRELAVVYVPTAPNPTSGYIEILPLEELVQTDWTVEEAMAFVVTGGVNAPATVRFGGGASQGS